MKNSSAPRAFITMDHQAAAAGDGKMLMNNAKTVLDRAGDEGQHQAGSKEAISNEGVSRRVPGLDLHAAHFRGKAGGERGVVPD